MEWVALPVAGGLYDQHPELIRQWSIILGIQAKFQKEEQDKREAESRHKGRR